MIEVVTVPVIVRKLSIGDMIRGKGRDLRGSVYYIILKLNTSAKTKNVPMCRTCSRKSFLVLTNKTSTSVKDFFLNSLGCRSS